MSYRPEKECGSRPNTACGFAWHRQQLPRLAGDPQGGCDERNPQPARCAYRMQSQRRFEGPQTRYCAHSRCPNPIRATCPTPSPNEAARWNESGPLPYFSSWTGTRGTQEGSVPVPRAKECQHRHFPYAPFKISPRMAPNIYAFRRLKRSWRRISESNGMPQVSVRFCEVSRPQGGVA